MNELNNLNYVPDHEKEKKNPLPIIIIVLLIIIIAGLCVYIAYDRGYITFDVDKEQPASPVEKDEEKEVTDKTVLADINNRVSIVEKIALVNYNHQVGTIYTYKDKTLRKDIEEKNKLISIIHSFNSDKSKLTLATFDIVKRYNESYLEGLDETNFNSLKYYYTIDASALKELYKDIYDEELNSYEGIALYPTVFYDKETDKILIDYEDHGGLGALSEELERYTIKITEDTKNVYVYVAAGLKTYDEYQTTCTYYNDVEQTKKYAEIPCDAQTIVSTINAENYKDFTNYKLRFTKKDNKYIFDSIERV